ncbi:MAG: prepilin-type N-terminal cleavage/methylation domain-containing protein [Phycisphaerae bacterium]|nr:prepilin-type N-terminal cleavage/methylation domain-containing protein [Phycisphaerae bacterium]
MRRYAHPAPAFHRGFTIVELLCVVGVLLVLVAMMMPRLSSARHQAQRVGTLSNMRQLGILHQSYADDHRGFVATLFAPVYRGPTDPPERVHIYPGAHIDGDWFANAHWAWGRSIPTFRARRCSPRATQSGTRSARPCPQVPISPWQAPPTPDASTGTSPPSKVRASGGPSNSPRPSSRARRDSSCR